MVPSPRQEYGKEQFGDGVKYETVPPKEIKFSRHDIFKTNNLSTLKKADPLPAKAKELDLQIPDFSW